MKKIVNQFGSLREYQVESGSMAVPHTVVQEVSVSTVLSNVVAMLRAHDPSKKICYSRDISGTGITPSIPSLGASLDGAPNTSRLNTLGSVLSTTPPSGDNVDPMLIFFEKNSKGLSDMFTLSQDETVDGGKVSRITSASITQFINGDTAFYERAPISMSWDSVLAKRHYSLNSEDGHSIIETLSKPTVDPTAEFNSYLKDMSVINAFSLLPPSNQSSMLKDLIFACFTINIDAIGEYIVSLRNDIYSKEIRDRVSAGYRINALVGVMRFEMYELVVQLVYNVLAHPIMAEILKFSGDIVDQDTIISKAGAYLSGAKYSLPSRMLLNEFTNGNGDTRYGNASVLRIPFELASIFSFTPAKGGVTTVKGSGPVASFLARAGVLSRMDLKNTGILTGVDLLRQYVRIKNGFEHDEMFAIHFPSIQTNLGMKPIDNNRSYGRVDTTPLLLSDGILSNQSATFSDVINKINLPSELLYQGRIGYQAITGPGIGKAERQEIEMSNTLSAIHSPASPSVVIPQSKWYESNTMRFDAMVTGYAPYKRRLDFDTSTIPHSTFESFCLALKLSEQFVISVIREEDSSGILSSTMMRALGQQIRTFFEVNESFDNLKYRMEDFTEKILIGGLPRYVGFSTSHYYISTRTRNSYRVNGWNPLSIVPPHNVFMVKDQGSLRAFVVPVYAIFDVEKSADVMDIPRTAQYANFCSDIIAELGEGAIPMI